MDVAVDAPGLFPKSPVSPSRAGNVAHGDYINYTEAAPVIIHGSDDESVPDDYVIPISPPPPATYMAQPPRTPKLQSIPMSQIQSQTRPYEYIQNSSAISVTSSKTYMKRDEVTQKNSSSADYANYVRMAYSVDEAPPWYLTLLLGFQHYLIMFGATVANPVALSDHLCIAKDDIETKSQLVSSIFVVSGICTLIQTTLGVRLPLVQGGTFIFVVPSMAILNLPQWKCPENVTTVAGLANYTRMNNLDEPLWKPRIREIQGAILVAGAVEFLMGLTGVMGFMVRFIGPLSIAPTITLAGLALFDVAARKSSTQWWITLVTVILIVAFSQYTKNVRVPCCKFQRGQGFSKENIAVFRLFPVILAISLTWMICAILTAANVFSSATWEGAKAELNVDFLAGAPWYNFPYPGQWGVPTVTSAGVLGMLAGVLASMVESIGDYYACARLARLPSPPLHAVNRGLTIEGLGCILAGAFGTSSGTTSYSENIGAIGITKVASRRVFQVSAVFMMVFGVFSKFGAIFASIPEPVTGGVFIVMFGMIAAVGLSNLQFVDLNSSRNLFIIGFSLFFGLTLPPYITSNTSSINTGSKIADQIIIVLLSTNMFVGGLAGFVLDNTIPGTKEERGLNSWRKEFLDEFSNGAPGGASSSKPGGSSVPLPTMGRNPLKTYDIPKISLFLNSRKWTKYIPIFPSFDEDLCVCCGKEKSKSLRDSAGRAQSREAVTQL